MNIRRASKASPSVQSGFTLIELMIAVTVVGILAAIAIPSYQDSVRKGRRGQAKADLVEAVQAMERHYTANNQYSGKTLKEIWGFDRSPKKGTQFYALAFKSDPTTREFTIEATPLSSTDQVKDKCGTLSIDQLGNKTPVTPEECWGR
ncbi:type IV pilin protein [Lysobacter sp. CA199]|uniref:type IV pilin protein n=1 Tax=Lysobacter sp. CA199 TaxID=3455608 RepID=UPI003F8D5687